MIYIEQMIDYIYTFIKTLIGIDFTAYAGSLPTQVITYFGYVDIIFKYISVFAVLYILFAFLTFIISLGGVRKNVK